MRSKSGPVAISTITASVNWLSDKRYLCVRINHQIGPLVGQSKSRYDRRLYIDKLWHKKTAIDEIFNDCRRCIVDKATVRYYLSILI